MIDFLRSIFFKDFWLKLVSLGLAILVYVVVSTLIGRQQVATGEIMDKHRIFQDVPVTLVSARGDVSQYRCEPETVTVTVQGTSKTIEGVDASGLQVMADLTYWDPQRGEEQLLLVTTPAGTAPLQVTPPRVQIVPPEQQP
jgi:YbbR domain-containing protein